LKTLFSTRLSFFLIFDLAHWMFQNLAAAGLAGIRNAHSGAFGGIHAAQPGQAGHLPVNTAGLSLQAQAVANQTAAYAGALPAALLSIEVINGSLPTREVYQYNHR
jgi:hypothetical protein